MRFKTIATLIATMLCVSAQGQTISNHTPGSRDFGTGAVTALDVRDHLMRSNSVAIKGERGDDVFDVWTRLRRGFEMDEVRPDLVRRWERYYSQNPAAFENMTRRAAPFLFYIVEQVDKRGMPMEVAILPFIESAFKPSVRSHAGAMGLWQFMPRTGDQYGLEQSGWFDSRDDFPQATKAALDYLQYTHDLFGDWALAFASYNAGEGRVGRAYEAAKRGGKAPVFDNLRLPGETTDYVPKLLAVRNILQNPESFGVRLETIRNRPYFEIVQLSQPIDMSAIARLAGMSEEELLFLNAAPRVRVWLPRDDRRLLLPVDKVDVFRSNLRRANPEKILSWQAHTLSKDSDVAEVAARAGMSVALFKEINHLGVNRLPAGVSVLVSKDADMSGGGYYATIGNREPAYDPRERDLRIASYGSAGNHNPYRVSKEPVQRAPRAAAPASKRRSATSSVTVRRGDTLYRIAKTNGMSVADLKALNNLRGDRINAGQKLLVRN